MSWEAPFPHQSHQYILILVFCFGRQSVPWPQITEPVIFYRFPGGLELIFIQTIHRLFIPETSVPDPFHRDVYYFFEHTECLFSFIFPNNGDISEISLFEWIIRAERRYKRYNGNFVIGIIIGSEKYYMLNDHGPAIQ